MAERLKLPLKRLWNKNLFLLFYKNPVLCTGIKLKLKATIVSFYFPALRANKATRYAGGGLLLTIRQII